MEDEHVAASALNEANDLIKNDAKKWNFVSPLALQDWKRRGRAVSGLTETQAKLFVRADGTDGDDTNGFFVSYFERNGAREKNPARVSPPESLLTLPSGVKVYNGEFRNQHKVNVQNVVQKIKEVQAVVENDKTSKNVSKTSTKVSDEIKATSKMAKKRSKKILWKRKQKEKKLLRLKNKPKKLE